MTIHIKLMWGMIEANSPPPPVHPKSLELFSKSFSNFREVELVLQNAGSARLVAQGEIETLKQGRAGTLKLGRGLLYVNETTIHSIHSHLARLGIYLWGPDLTEAPDSCTTPPAALLLSNRFARLPLTEVYTLMSIGGTSTISPCYHKPTITLYIIYQLHVSEGKSHHPENSK